MAKIRQIVNRNIKPSKWPLVIGYFSCVHVMHSQLLNMNHHFNVLTFKDFYTKNSKAIYTFEQRIANIAKYKPVNIYVFDLNKHNMTAQDFVYKVLKTINPSEIIVGSDFKFGLDHKSADFLKQYFNVNVIPYNKQISTTNIVKALKAGKLEQANDYLDEPYYYQNKWIGGNKLGRKLGFRTINLKVNKNIVLPEGAYVSYTKIGNKKYPSISFLGISKTTGSLHKSLESHILNKNIAPRTLFPSAIRNNVKVSFLKPIRKNKKFANGQKLVEQLKKDKEFAIKYFKENI